MRRIFETVVIVVWVALAAGQATAAGTPSGSDPGDQIKQGATKVGQGIEEGATKVGQGIKQGAINLWEATKAAVSAGADKLTGHGSPQQGKSSQAVPPQK
jgi:hypothetical protein